MTFKLSSSMIAILLVASFAGCLAESENTSRDIMIHIDDVNIMFEESTPVCGFGQNTFCHVISIHFDNQEKQDNSISKSKWSAVSSNGGLFEAVEAQGNEICVSTYNCSVTLGFDIPEGEYVVELRWEGIGVEVSNYDPASDDTQVQMSSKVSVLNMYIHSLDDDADRLLLYFKLAPGSETIDSNNVNWTIICESDSGDATEFADGDFSSSTDMEGNDDSARELIAGETYQLILQLQECRPEPSTDHIFIISVQDGGSTYENIQYPNEINEGEVII